MISSSWFGVPYSEKHERSMSSSILCTWPVSLRRPGGLWWERSLLNWWVSHGIGQKVHGRPVHPIQMIPFSMPNALSMWLSGEPRHRHGTGWNWKENRLAGVQMSLLVLMLCSTRGFVPFQGLCLAAVPWLHCKLERLGHASCSSAEVARRFQRHLGSTEVHQQISWFSWDLRGLNWFHYQKVLIFNDSWSAWVWGCLELSSLPVAAKMGIALWRDRHWLGVWCSEAQTRLRRAGPSPSWPRTISSIPRLPGLSAEENSQSQETASGAIHLGVSIVTGVPP